MCARFLLAIVECGFCYAYNNRFGQCMLPDEIRCHNSCTPSLGLRFANHFIHQLRINCNGLFRIYFIRLTLHFSFAARMKSARSIRFPCGVCSQKCLTGSIHCDACKTWFHSRCDQLSDADMVEMGDSDLTYICARCCLGSDGGFDYEASLRRLSATKISMRQLALAVKREDIFLRMHSFKFNVAGSQPDHANSQVDHTDVNILNRCGGGDTDGGRPLYVDGDGNCLFNALPVLLIGSQVLSAELRLRTCLELVNH